VKEKLEAEEKKLTLLRDTTPKEEFEALTRDFDRRVRIERRAAQERGASLQKFISEAQEALLKAADPVLRELRVAKGAALLIDIGAVVAHDPAIDVTDEAIARFDAAVSEVTFTPPDDLGLE
jgi:Skp family chaperone for outer membrane proteins